MRFGLVGALSKLGTAVQVFICWRGRWWFEPSNLGVYRGHTVAQAVTTMTAKGHCTKKVMAPCLPGGFPDEVTCLELDGVRTGCANWTRLICWPQHRRRRASAQLVTP
jgi:hypothetical protein